LIANTFLMDELETLRASASAGYSRGKIKRPPKPKTV
jgi:hypothetical protein